jgi:hypothetical protein
MDARDAGERLEEIRTDVLVLFHPEDEPAPRGRLGRLDWILLGALSRLGARGKFTGARGSSALLSPNQKVKAERILVMGVGRRADLSMTAFYRLSYDTAHTVLNLGCSRISLDLPCRLLPQESSEKLRHAFLEGFVAELKRGRPDGDFAVSALPPANGR